MRNVPRCLALFASFLGACLLTARAEPTSPNPSLGQSGVSSPPTLYTPFFSTPARSGCLTFSFERRLVILRAQMRNAEARYKRLDDEIARDQRELDVLRASPKAYPGQVAALEKKIDRDEDKLDDIDDDIDDIGSTIADILDPVGLRHISWSEVHGFADNWVALETEWNSVATGQYNCKK